MTHVVNDVTEDFDGARSLTHPDDGEYRKLTDRLLNNKVLPEEPLQKWIGQLRKLLANLLGLKGDRQVHPAGCWVCSKW